MCLQINLYLQRKHWPVQQNWKVVQKSFSCGLAMVITISLGLRVTLVKYTGIKGF